MALQVAKPKPQPKLTVAKPTPQPALTVTRNYGFQGATYNPQQTYNPQPQAPSPQRTYNPQASTYNPQQAATAAAVAQAAENARITAETLIRQQQEAADRARIAAAEEKKRKTDAFNSAVDQGKKGFINKAAGKVGLGNFLLQRRQRQNAAKYVDKNGDWFLYIEARKRQYERDAATRQADLVKHSFDPDYVKKVDEYNAWADKEYKALVADAQDYTGTQQDLAKFSQTPIKGRAATVINTVNKVVKTPLNVASKTWGALTWTASQPSRAVNTAINYVDPNRVRNYYGGAEKSGGVYTGSPVSQLKNAYNASKDQRLAAFTKASEKRIVTPKTGTIMVNGKPRKVTYNPSWLDKARGKYGDDIVDLIADPMNLLGAAGVGDKVINKTNAAKKFVAESKVIKSAAKTPVGKAAGWLFGESKSRYDRASEKGAALIKQMSDEGQRFKMGKNDIYGNSALARGLVNADTSKTVQNIAGKNKQAQAAWDKAYVAVDDLNRDFVGELSRHFTDDEVRKMSIFARTGEWQGHTPPARVKAMTDFIRAYQTKAHEMANAEGLVNRAKNYLPDVHGVGNEPYNFRKSRTRFGNKYHGQNTQQLQRSMVLREFQSNWDGSHGHIRTMRRLEKSIRRNAQKANRALTDAEKKKIELLTHRQKHLADFTSKHKSRMSELNKMLDKTYQDTKPLMRVSRSGIDRNLTMRGAWNTAKDTAALPMNTWRKSVLKYRPAWYVNNLGWNVPAAVSAGGAGALKEMAKMTVSRNYRSKAMQDAEMVKSSIGREIGKGGRLSRFGSAIEDIPRAAAFNALKKKGYSDELAKSHVNDWLFNYKNKRIEQPIRQVYPFYNWTKGLTKLAGTMPLRYPRQAEFYSKFYDQYYQRPYNQLPAGDQTYTDPATGEQVTYNPRSKYKGRMKIGNKWVKTPFNAMTPEQLGQINVNPALTVASELSTSKDQFGLPTTDRTMKRLIAEKFPQAKLGMQFADRNLAKFKRWFSESNYGKEAQGTDPSARNYMEKLDQNKKFKKGLGSFLGVPSVITQDPKADKEHKRYTDFNKDYFKTDWEKRYKQLLDEDPATAWAKLSAEKQKVAGKYGYNFEKDIMKGLWTKYDTATTSRTKGYKEDAQKFANQYWNDYKNLPKPQFVKTAKGGYYTPSTAKPYWINLFKKWQQSGVFASNPYYRLPYYNEKDAAGNKTGKKSYVDPYKLTGEVAASEAKRASGQAKYQAGMAKKAAYDKAKATGDWSAWRATYGDTRKHSPYEYGGKFFKTAESRDRYVAGQSKHAEAEFWQKYYATDNYDERNRLLDANPQYRRFARTRNFQEALKGKSVVKALQIQKAQKLAGYSADYTKYMGSTVPRVAFMSRQSRPKKVVLKLK